MTDGLAKSRELGNTGGDSLSLSSTESERFILNRDARQSVHFGIISALATYNSFLVVRISVHSLFVPRERLFSRVVVSHLVFNCSPVY